MAEETKTRYDHHRGQEPLIRPGFKWRTAVFLLFDLAAFVVVNAYWYYTGSGQWCDFGLGTYYRNLQTPLGSTFLEPLSIFSHPWMICVTGLLLAAIIFAPIIIAVLYRLTVAIAFVLVVLIVGHAPVTAMALLAGCFLAARTTLRSDMPFVASLLGLLPVIIYMIISGFALADSAAVLPLQKWLISGPLLLALVTAIIATSLVLALAKITNFRPGVVMPILALLLAGPLTVFYTKIGPAELEYYLIVSRLAPGDALLEPVSMQTWIKQNNTEGIGQAPLRNRVRDMMFIKRMELTEACNQFLSSRPDSSRAVEIAWVKGQCQSMQVDESKLADGLVVYNASYPLLRALGTWEKLLADYPNRDQAALAQWRCAQLTIRNGDVEKGERLLADALKKLNDVVGKPVEPSPNDKFGGIFSPPGELPSRSYYEAAFFEADKLEWLIRENKVLEDPEAAKVLIAWTRLNPYHIGYAERLKKLIEQYEATSLGHNLLVAYALTLEDPDDRFSQLIHLADTRASLRDADAAIEANWELGQLMLKAPRLIKENGAAPPEEYFKQVKNAPKNPWTKLAEERVKWLEGTNKASQ